MELNQIFIGSSIGRLAALQTAIEFQEVIRKNPTTYHFNHDVVIQIMHGGLLFYHCAHLVEWKDYIFVYPEHAELSVHKKDELEFWAEYKHMQIKKLTKV